MLKRFGVVFEYSMAWLLPIAGLSFVIAWLKFRKLSKLPDISKGMALLISGLRFIVIFTLLALLLNPAFSWVEKTKEKPLLVLAQDNSASLIKTKVHCTIGRIQGIFRKDEQGFEKQVRYRSFNFRSFDPSKR